MKIKLNKDILFKNNLNAQEVRQLLTERGITAFNLMASPGAGKTSLILSALKLINQRVLVIEGDIASSIDTLKIKEGGFEALQINTGGSCHLTASMIKKVISEVKDGPYKLIFIENVGNLVCPAPYDLGENYKIVISSLPEGDDKPYKYPKIFSVADVIILNKIDLINSIDYNYEYFEKGVRAVNIKAPIIKTSCKTGEGLQGWVNWIYHSLN
ncbi:MAG: Hydrogenase isoenzymes nickel incorporation protein HypB [candidate division WS2 bacterium]|uniref:Hydrogenase isoenzymes nickel incorporation protein HypB n=1 Tax=Psychracetigena formicireducens TaxID=2986056 RepID=A0A9E2BHL1_PSYF1|nr:Hydrogenase isoenzymes nickel incorporation protein HypB [Candidatus Psychracetigena formicireducens]